MSRLLNGNLIAGISQNTKYNAHHLLDFKWTDCIMNDVSWLRADTFSWQSGDVYTSAYNHLVQDIQGITAETETIGSYTVTFYRATDGHKICLADQETTIANIYSETGIAWYYILDTTNTQFKLPRTKFGFEGLRTNVGDNINESLPNINGKFNIAGYSDNITSLLGGETGAFKRGTLEITDSGCNFTSNTGKRYNVLFNANNSNNIYQDNAPVQERATQMYLYFYVGDYTQSAIEQTAGLNAELFNNKVDLNASNLSSQGMSYIAGLGMPKGRYKALTAGASGSSYIAPTNGYVLFTVVGTGVCGINIGRPIYNKSEATGNYFSVIAPVHKNQSFTISYNGTTPIELIFFYSSGSESEAQ